jgi:tryptophanyl-tRNA synthetase
MSKSLNNCIYLSDSEEELRKKVFKVYTDPDRIHATDPGKIEGNVAFLYMDLFNDDKDEVEDMKKRYREGNIKDVEVKERLFEVMKEKLAPIRERRKEAEGMKEELLRKAIEGSVKTSSIAKETIAQMKKAMLLEFK